MKNTIWKNTIRNPMLIMPTGRPHWLSAPLPRARQRSAWARRWPGVVWEILTKSAEKVMDLNRIYIYIYMFEENLDQFCEVFFFDAWTINLRTSYQKYGCSNGRWLGNSSSGAGSPLFIGNIWGRWRLQTLLLSLPPKHWIDGSG